MNDTLAHGIVAFFTPIAWALILYPYSRYRKNAWKRMITLSIIFSFLVMIVKEIFDNNISGMDVMADILGLFFGVACISILFSLGNKMLSKAALGLERHISLRDLLVAAVSIERRGVKFYEDAAKQVRNLKANELCLTLAKEEALHAKNIAALLNRWLTKAPDPDFLVWVEEEAMCYNIFRQPIAQTASEQEIILYAIAQEKNSYAFYASFRDYFPDTWKRIHIDTLMQAEKDHEIRLAKLLKELRGA